MSTASDELVLAQARLARLLEKDAKYAQAETMLRSVWDEPMSTAVRFEVGRTFLRVLRLRNKWDELETALASLLKSAQEAEDTEQVAQLLILRMEADLCAYPNHPEKCIETADLLLSISQSPELQYRALGHKGLSYLALGDIRQARQYLDEGVAVAERSDDPESIFLAWHFSSQFAIATLDLLSAIKIGHRLISISEEHAVARDEPFHLRDLSRAELLADSVPDSVGHLATYLLANTGTLERARALTYTVLMVGEAMSIVGAPAARDFVVALRDAVAGDAGLTDDLDRLIKAVDGGDPPIPSDFVSDEIAIEAATRIFCFNSDKLDDIRQAIALEPAVEDAQPSEGPGEGPDDIRPVIIVDRHSALRFFRDSFVSLDAAGLDEVLSADQLSALRSLAPHFDVLVTKGAE